MLLSIIKAFLADFDSDQLFVLSLPSRVSSNGEEDHNEITTIFVPPFFVSSC